MKLYTVYKHTSPSGKVYIGITSKKPEYRWNHGRGYKEIDQPVFYRAIKKYGWDNITHEILYSGLQEKDAKNLEISLIKQYKSLGLSYNITDGGEGTNGFHHSLESRHKMSEIMKARCQTEYGRMICSKAGKANKGNKYNRKSGFSKGHYHMRNVLQFTKEGSLINTYISIRDVCRYTNFTYNCLCQALNGRRGGLYKGYIWKYEEKQ